MDAKRKLPKFKAGQVVAEPIYSGSGGTMTARYRLVLAVNAGDPWRYRLEDYRWYEESELRKLTKRERGDA